MPTLSITDDPVSETVGLLQLRLFRTNVAGRTDDLMPTWRDAPEVEAIAGPIIQEHHRDLIGYPVRFCFRDPARKLHNKTCAGTAEIISGRFAHFVMTDDEKAMEGQESGPRMFWIEIAEELWETFTEKQQKALVDHELCHCELIEDMDGGIQMSIKAHDIEEFNAIVRRHGLWGPGLWEFGLTVAESWKDVEGS